MAKGKLTPELQEHIVSSIEAGNYAKVAAAAAGIDEKTFYNWLNWGEEAKSGKYFQFFQSVKKAEAKGETRAVGVVNAGFGDDWKAAMTYLERKYPDRWGRRERHEHTGAGGGDIAIRVVYDDSHS